MGVFSWCRRGSGGLMSGLPMNAGFVHGGVLAVLERGNNGVPGTAFLTDRVHFFSAPALVLSARSHACSRPSHTLHSPYTRQVNERQNPRESKPPPSIPPKPAQPTPLLRNMSERKKLGGGGGGERPNMKSSQTNTEETL